MVSHKKSINQKSIKKNIIMKNSVLILGIALVSFSNISNARNTINLKNNLFQNTIISNDGEVKKSHVDTKFKKPSFEDIKVFNPETIIVREPKTIKEIIIEGDKIVENTVSDDLEFMEYEESMREIIAQSDLITENIISDDTHPLYIERTVEDEIAELELIIESKETNELNRLDFKKINSNSILNNSFNTKKIIGMN